MLPKKKKKKSIFLSSEKGKGKDMTCTYYCKNTALAAWHPLPKFERSQYEDGGGKKEIFYQNSLLQVKHAVSGSVFPWTLKERDLKKVPENYINNSFGERRN